MKSRSLLIVIAVSLATTLYFAVTYGLGQIGGSFGGANQSGNGRSFGLDLIDDLPKASPKEAGRFQIVSLVNHSLLLDTKSGDTWMLHEDPDQENSLSWIEVPRLKQKPRAAQPAADEKAKPRAKVDPFG